MWSFWKAEPINIMSVLFNLGNLEKLEKLDLILLMSNNCRNNLLNLKWLEVTVSLGLPNGASWTGGEGFVACGGVKFWLYSNQLTTLHLCFDWHL